jgi:hypothetical protein
MQKAKYYGWGGEKFAEKLNADLEGEFLGWEVANIYPLITLSGASYPVVIFRRLPLSGALPEMPSEPPPATTILLTKSYIASRLKELGDKVVIGELQAVLDLLGGV